MKERDEFGITILVLIAANTTPNAYHTADALYILVAIRLLVGVVKVIHEIGKRSRDDT